MRMLYTHVHITVYHTTFPGPRCKTSLDIAKQLQLILKYPDYLENAITVYCTKDHHFKNSMILPLQVLARSLVLAQPRPPYSCFLTISTAQLTRAS